MNPTPPRRPARPLHPIFARAIRLTTGLIVLQIAIAVADDAILAVGRQPSGVAAPDGLRRTAINGMAPDGLRRAANNAVAPDKVVAVAPTGWRRTAAGWERAGDWMQPTAEDLSQRVVDQIHREPAVMRSSLGIIRRVGPLGFAAGQVAFVTALILIMSGRTKRVQDGA